MKSVCHKFEVSESCLSSSQLKTSLHETLCHKCSRKLKSEKSKKQVGVIHWWWKKDVKKITASSIKRKRKNKEPVNAFFAARLVAKKWKRKQRACEDVNSFFASYFIPLPLFLFYLNHNCFTHVLYRILRSACV